MSERISVSAADVAAIAAVLTMSSAVMGGVGEPDNDFFPGDQVAGTPDGVLIESDLEDRGCGYGYGPAGDGIKEGGGYGGCGPDTTLGIFGDDGSLLHIDDDGSFLGNGLASAVFGIPIEPSGTIDWAVSGYADFDFDGLDDDFGSPHAQLGGWDAYVEYYDSAGEYLEADYLGFYEFIIPGDVERQVIGTPGGAASFDLYLDNSIGDCFCGDVDYYCVSDLDPGTEYEIRITDADFDSVLGLADDQGNIIDYNDDDPDAGCCLSVLNGVADESGNLYFVVSGYDDFDLDGSHYQFGTYSVAVSPAFPGCNEADLTEPFGLLDLSDVTTFAVAFTSQNSLVDYDGNGLFDLTDINTFVGAFLDGCP